MRPAVRTQRETARDDRYKWVAPAWRACSFTDAQVERYWQLLAIINGQPVPPCVVPGFEWLIAALRASLS